MNFGELEVNDVFKADLRIGASVIKDGVFVKNNQYGASYGDTRLTFVPDIEVTLLTTEKDRERIKQEKRKVHEARMLTEPDYVENIKTITRPVGTRVTVIMEVVDDYETRHLTKSIFHTDAPLVAGCKVISIDTRDLHKVLREWEAKERATLRTLGYEQRACNGDWYRKEPLSYIGRDDASMENTNG